MGTGQFDSSRHLNTSLRHITSTQGTLLFSPLDSLHRKSVFDTSLRQKSITSTLRKIRQFDTSNNSSFSRVQKVWNVKVTYFLTCRKHEFSGRVEMMAFLNVSKWRVFVEMTCGSEGFWGWNEVALLSKWCAEVTRTLYSKMYYDIFQSLSVLIFLVVGLATGVSFQMCLKGSVINAVAVVIEFTFLRTFHVITRSLVSNFLLFKKYIFNVLYLRQQKKLSNLKE